MRTRAVAEEVQHLCGEPLFVVDDELSAEELRAAGFQAVTALERPGWSGESARGAWLDGPVDWSRELRGLAGGGTPSHLVENKRPCRELATCMVQPKLHDDPDGWERRHASRILRGAGWIPLLRAVRSQGNEVRDLDLLVTFGGSDPLRSTERVLAAVPAGLRVAVSVGAHMGARRGEIERAARHLRAEVLPGNASLAGWMARARVAITALGTTLYELAHLRTPALILANHDDDRPVLDFYRQHGPFHPLGLTRELSDLELSRGLVRGLDDLTGPLPPIPGLGPGAERLARKLLGLADVAQAA